MIFSYICSQLQKTSLVYKPKFQTLIKLSIMKHLERKQMNAVKAGAGKKTTVTNGLSSVGTSQSKAGNAPVVAPIEDGASCGIAPLFTHFM